MQLATRHGINVSLWADTLQMPELRGVRGAIPTELVKQLHRRIEDTRKQLDETIGDDRPPERFNAWRAALEMPGPLHTAIRALTSEAAVTGARTGAVKLALRRLLGLSAWGVIPHGDRVMAGGRCGLCGAGCGVVDRTRGPRATLDAAGDHVSACLGVLPEAGNLARHNRIARLCEEIGLRCGVQIRVHDGPVFEVGRDGSAAAAGRGGQRPADWFERGAEVTAADAARYVGGRCVDLTVRAGGAAALAAAVAEKKRKYESGMRQHPHLALTVFAVGTDGSGSEGVEETFSRWSVWLLRQRRANADLVGRPIHEIRSAFGVGFATAMYLQLKAYAKAVDDRRSSGILGRRGYVGGYVAARGCNISCGMAMTDNGVAVLDGGQSDNRVAPVQVLASTSVAQPSVIGNAPIGFSPRDAATGIG
jgi:hypothetical protein